MKIYQNYDLSKLNTFSIQANAKFFVEIKNEQELKKLFIFSPFIQAFGGMAPGIESISSTWIDVIQNGLKKKNILTRDDLLYFELHTVVDMKHSGLFRNAIIPYLNTETSRKLLRDGALIMVNAQKWLFDGIAKDFSSPY